MVKLYHDFSHLLKQKEQPESSEEKLTNTGTTEGDEKSHAGSGLTNCISTNETQISVMDPIDTVFKIVNLAPAGGSSSNLSVPGQPQLSNGASLKPESSGTTKSQPPSLLSKSRTSEWFANLFSPSKSRNNSSSTETSRLVTFEA